MTIDVAKTYPLLLALHGAYDHASQALDLFGEEAKQQDVFLLNEFKKSSPSSTIRILSSLEYLLRLFRRIFRTVFSTVGLSPVVVFLVFF
jgi:hypothetical protein